MVFICPSKEESERRKDVLCKLKCIVDKLTEEHGSVPVQMCPLPQACCHPCCHPCYSSFPPQCQAPPAAQCEKEQQICMPPDMMVCYKIKKPTKATEAKKTTNESKTKKDDDTQVKQSKSRELRGGILYSGCDCEKRNGLQDDCQRSECRGSPACLTKPNPTCGPSQFSNGKHLGKKSYKIGETGEGVGDGSGGAGGNNGINALIQSTDEYMCFPAVLDTSHICPC